MTPTSGFTLQVHGRLVDLSRPCVMGILNATPDSFFAGSRKQTEHDISRRADEIVEQGGAIIDVGACSTRPGAGEVSEAKKAILEAGDVEPYEDDYGWQMVDL